MRSDRFDDKKMNPPKLSTIKITMKGGGGWSNHTAYKPGSNLDGFRPSPHPDEFIYYKVSLFTL